MAFELSFETKANPLKPELVNLWNHPSYREAVCSLYDIESHLLIIHKGNEQVAAIPLFERSKLGFKHLICPVLSYYQPLMIRNSDGMKEARILLDNIQMTNELALFLKSRYRKIQFNLSPQTLDTRSFSWAGLKVKPLYTFVHRFDKELSPVRDEAEKLKRAAKKGFVYENTFAPLEFISLLKNMCDRKDHVHGLSYKGLHGFLSKMHDAGLLIQQNVLLEGRIVSSSIIFGLGSGTAYAIMRATDDKEMSSGASAWHTMKTIEYLKQSYDMIDFCGGNVRDVARFKAALGLDLEVFFRIEGKGGLLG